MKDDDNIAERLAAYDEKWIFVESRMQQNDRDHEKIAGEIKNVSRRVEKIDRDQVAFRSEITGGKKVAFGFFAVLGGIGAVIIDYLIRHFKH